MCSNEGVGDTFHLAREGGLVLTTLLFLFVFLSPADGIFAFIAIVVGHINDIGSLELEGTYSFYLELAAVEAFGGEDSDGFGGSSVGDSVDLCLDGFFLCAQFAQEF